MRENDRNTADRMYVTAVMRLGQSTVKPFEYFIATAQVTSNRAASSR